jgi:dTDP-4-dehydrorhamnose reductase
MTKKIGIIGANGQLGLEVCLLLRETPGIEPVPICRNEVGATFLRRCGFDVRIGSVDNEAKTRALLEGLDLIADFSLPAGSSSYVRAQMRTTLGNVIQFAPAGIPFVYLSSILAFGNPDFHHELKSYRFSLNAYGSTKRYAEELASGLAAKHHRPAFLFRVGVVHGEFQAATRQALKDLQLTSHLPAYVPDCDSYTVFTSTIAEALVSAVERRDEPGLYTLVSNPAWSWSDLHQYFCRRAGIEQQIILLEPRPIRNSRFASRLKRSLFSALGSRKEILNGYVGAVMPDFEQKMRAVYHMRNAAADIQAGIEASRYMPYFDNFSVYPGKRLKGVSDSRVTQHVASSKIRQLVDNLVNNPQNTAHDPSSAVHQLDTLT